MWVRSERISNPVTCVGCLSHTREETGGPGGHKGQWMTMWDHHCVCDVSMTKMLLWGAWLYRNWYYNRMFYAPQLWRTSSSVPNFSRVSLWPLDSKPQGLILRHCEAAGAGQNVIRDPEVSKSSARFLQWFQYESHVVECLCFAQLNSFGSASMKKRKGVDSRWQSYELLVTLKFSKTTEAGVKVKSCCLICQIFCLMPAQTKKKKDFFF